MKQFQIKKNYTYEELKMIIQSIPGNVFFKDTQCRYQMASHICSMLNSERDEFAVLKEIQTAEELNCTLKLIEEKKGGFNCIKDKQYELYVFIYGCK